MNCKQYYNLKNVSYIDRESFNNTILLLTMVKSDYYYIVGFSRLENRITIAFDFKSDYDCVLTEHIDINFSDDNYIVLSSKLESANLIDRKIDISPYENNHFRINNGTSSYLKKIQKDSVFPIGIQKMNEYILSAKNEIVLYINDCLNNL